MEFRLALLQEVACAGFWEYDLCSGQVKADVQLFALYGSSPSTDSDTGNTASSLDALRQHVHPDDLPRVEMHLREVCERPQPWNLTYRIIRNDGLIRHFRSVGRVESDAQGEPHRLICLEQDITDYQETLQALLERQRQLDTIFYRTSKISLIQGGLDGVIQDASLGAEALFGYPREELIGQSVSVLYPDGEQSIPADLIERLHQTGQEVTEEVRHIHRSGTEFPALLNLVPIHDEEHQLVGVIGVCMDLSEQAAERERYRMAQEAARFGIWEWNPEHDEVHWDEATWRMLGYDLTSKQRLRFSDWRAQVHPEDLAEVEPVVLEHIKQGTPFTIEYRYYRADGSWLWVQARGQIVKHTPDGRPQLLIGTHVEIEQLKHTEHELRLREQELQQAAIIFEESREGIVIADSDARIITTNRAFTEITGYPEEQAIGWRPQDLLESGYHDEAFFEALWQAVDELGTWTGEMWGRRRDGKIYSEWTTIRKLHDEQYNQTYYVIIFAETTDIKEYQQQLEHILYVDPLTELPNRTLFWSRLEQALRQKPNNSILAVLLADFRSFGELNYSLGHAAGDHALRLIGKRFGEAMDQTATVARLSGDEFAVLLPQLKSPDEAAIAAERLLATVEEPVPFDGNEIPLSMCLGVGIAAQEPASAATIMEQANAALREAKREGVGCRFYSEELTQRARDHVQLASDMRRALDADQFAIHYQPQVSLTSGRWCGLEALLRWDHPDHGPISPARFIPVAERSGLIGRLGTWVLERACREYQELRAKGHDWGSVAVNITAPELAEPAFTDRVLETLERTSLPPSCLELEITESLWVNTDPKTVETLERLRRHGVSVAVDDFGTGYSALSYLKDLPVDRIKIDRSFIHALEHESRATTITDAILALGQSLGLTVVAEGIETREQEAYLREAGCARGQGFYYARPAPLDALLLCC
ncbi:EAL domain-containing protein [Halorhodospira halochloris]|uniref:EAL domain-containing protein n=1 Tax=Halorhodospira halochloris TaxID=1052 RepID=UPI001EE7A4F5|nr:EAL domain-containing protein [Halorhodospira halochloris]MCG5548516.1 EAL domain-containing protein [Halorhodospira halochloris]